ncbi:MAG: 30S ribosomal protein S12 methylthiotransferase RimO [Clostridia bacterium]
MDIANEDKQIIIGVVSLGCDKNRVDTEKMLFVLKQSGYGITAKAENADIIIVNTCAFILPARKESINTILEMAEYKTKGKCKKLVVTGCLPQKYLEEIKDEIPEIDCFLGVSQYKNIDKIIAKLLNEDERIIDCSMGEELSGKERILTTKQYAYLKIADGCNNKCTYCMIPSIRGKYRSYTIENLACEAEMLVIQGIRELILVAQDVTNYGVDLYGRYSISDLIDRLCMIPGIEKIRLLYCYPERIDDRFIEMMRSNDKIVKYLDIPIQHASDRILKLMGRRSTNESLRNLFNKLRTAMPEIAIRTTFIVGFPTETEEDVNILSRFLYEMKFTNAGFFSYSLEEGTPSAQLKKRVKPFDIKKRISIVSHIQAEISKARNKAKVDKIISVTVDELIDKTSKLYIYKGRTYENAPDIDGFVEITSNTKLKVSETVQVKITGYNEYDLMGETVSDII